MSGCLFSHDLLLERLDFRPFFFLYDSPLRTIWRAFCASRSMTALAMTLSGKMASQSSKDLLLVRMIEPVEYLLSTIM